MGGGGEAGGYPFRMTGRENRMTASAATNNPGGQDAIFFRDGFGFVF